MIVCDAHVHLFGPLSRYPVAGQAPFVVPDARPEDLLSRMDAHGVTHAVIVHAAVSGRDNRRTLDALREHPSRFRGVLTPPLATPDDATLQAWNALGVRGIRFSHTRTAQQGMSVDRTLAARIAELGWHSQVHVEGTQLVELETELATLPGRIVIDHMGRIPASEGVRSAAFEAMLRLIDRGNAWVKLSAPMRLSSEAAPPYEDVAVMARALARHAPQRVLWGSDWPNVNLASEAPPYGELLRLIETWSLDAGLRRRMLADNPAELYDLPSAR